MDKYFSISHKKDKICSLVTFAINTLFTMTVSVLTHDS